LSIANRIPEQTPIVDWNALPLLLNEKKTSNLLGVSLSYLRKSRSEGTIRDRTIEACLAMRLRFERYLWVY
jgi:hypothetical protein